MKNSLVDLLNREMERDAKAAQQHHDLTGLIAERQRRIAIAAIERHVVTEGSRALASGGAQGLKDAVELVTLGARQIERLSTH